jgi:DNA-binding phage protein
MTDTNDKIEFDQDEVAKLEPWRAADHLSTDEDIAGYLVAVLDEPDADPEKEVEVLCSAIRDVITALRKRAA